MWPFFPPSRGPAKGYIEALETRLKETERALWRLVSVSSAETLSSAFAEPISAQIPSSLSVTTLETTEEKKSAIAYWERAPIQSVEEVLAWKHRVDHPLPGETDMAMGSSDTVGEARQYQQRHHHRQDDAHSSSEPSPTAPTGRRGDPSEHADTNDAAISFLAPSLMSPTTVQFQSSTLSPGNQENNIVVNDRQRQPPAGPADRLKRRRDEPVRTPNWSYQAEAASKFGLSKEFQDTFLW